MGMCLRRRRVMVDDGLCVMHGDNNKRAKRRGII
jgi:hypothetical protein